MFLTANCPFHKSGRLIEVLSLIKRSVLRDLLDCLQSVFSLKIRLVLVSSSAIANHDVIIAITVFFFSFSGLRPPFSRLAASPLACLGLACSNFAKKNKRLLAV